MRVHGEKGAEEKSLPGKLRGIVDPTTQDEDEQVAGLNEDVEGRAAFECDGAGVVKVNGEKNCSKPEDDPPAGVNPENADEWKLPRCDLPTERAELLSGTARAEHVGTFAGIEAVAFGVSDVVDAVKEQTERKNDVKESEPKGAAMPIERIAQGHQIERGCGGPEARARDLYKDFEVGKDNAFCDGMRSCLRGDAHRVGCEECSIVMRGPAKLFSAFGENETAEVNESAHESGVPS